MIEVGKRPKADCRTRARKPQKTICPESGNGNAATQVAWQCGMCREKNQVKVREMWDILIAPQSSLERPHNNRDPRKKSSRAILCLGCCRHVGFSSSPMCVGFRPTHGFRSTIREPRLDSHITTYTLTQGTTPKDCHSSPTSLV